MTQAVNTSMKTLFTQIAICFFIFFAGVSSLHAQTFNWVTGGGTPEDLSGQPSQYWEQTKFICTDANGNIYALSQIGNYYSVVADTFSQYSIGVNPNVLLTSYNCSGQMRWAKLLQNTGYGVTPFGIQADNLGNIYVAGSFGAGGSTMYIGNDTTIGPPTSDYLSTGLIQFDTSGHFKWIRYVGANTYASELAVAELAAPIVVDASNNAHFFCYVKATGIPLMTGVASVYGTYDLEYNSLGTLLSATRLQLDSSLAPYGATIDKQSGKAYLYGYRNNSFADSSNYTFISSFDQSRNRIWIDTVGCPSQPLTEGFFLGVVADDIGHIYLCGTNNGYLVYMGDTMTPPVGAYGGYASFIMKTDTAGHI